MVELVPETELVLLDRALLVGDVVKHNPHSSLSGTVVSRTARYTLTPLVVLPEGPRRLDTATVFNALGNFSEVTLEHLLHEVPAEELRPSHTYRVGDLVIYQEWVGFVEEVDDEVTIRLDNGTVVVVEDAGELELTGHPALAGSPPERFVVGDAVRTKKGNLRRGRWKFGAYSPNTIPEGKVVEIRTVTLTVNWLCRRIGGPSPPSEWIEEPPPELDIDLLESGTVHLYDRMRSPRGPSSTQSQAGDVKLDDFSLGSHVRFNDLSGACVKYNGLTRIPRASALGFDINVFSVAGTQTGVTVLWQDLTTSKHTSISLIPDSNVDDEDEAWPGEIVCTKARKAMSPQSVVTVSSEGEWSFEPEKVGVVQSVNASDRIARVRWFSNPSVRFFSDVVLPGGRTGELAEAVEEVSLYDIRTPPSLNRRRGDFVIIHSFLSLLDMCLDQGQNSISWFGEIVDLQLDGRVVVRLGALDEVVDVAVPAEDVTLVYNPDEADELVGSQSDDTSMTDESAMQDILDDMEGVVGDDGEHRIVYEQWIENEEGERMDEDGSDEAWFTEDGEDDESLDDKPDTPMTDVKPSASPHTTPDSTPTSTSAITAESGDIVKGLSSRPGAPPSFAVLDSHPPSDHPYLHESPSTAPQLMRRIQKEHKILRTSLPDGIFVRTWESRLDLLRVLIIGPTDTPYELAPFLIDLHLHSTFPSSPPSAFFHSWTSGYGPVNPNLYEDGKICLSLLGTWHADSRAENWSPARSTILQVLVSLQSLVLVSQPYYNEAGFEVRAGSQESRIPAALYAERAYFRARAFVVHALTHGALGLDDVLAWLYVERAEGAPRLLERAVEAAKKIIERSEQAREGEFRDGLRIVSAGALIPLRRQVELMEKVAERLDGQDQAQRQSRIQA